MKFRTVYDPGGSVRLVCEDESRTKQSFRDECDINSLVDRFQVSGLLPSASGTAKYGDFTSSTSYFESMSIVLDAQNQFDSLPAKVRDRFHNDPVEFLAFAENSENADELVKLGLATHRVPTEAIEPNLTPSDALEGQPIRSPKGKKGSPAVGEGPNS